MGVTTKTREQREIALLQAVILKWEDDFPCDMGCYADGSPHEDCSQHGRSPADLWSIIQQISVERDNAIRKVEAAAALIPGSPLRRIRPADLARALEMETP